MPVANNIEIGALAGPFLAYSVSEVRFTIRLGPHHESYFIKKRTKVGFQINADRIALSANQIDARGKSADQRLR